MQTIHRSRLLSEINIVPLVDVVLVLLIIFMVTAPLLYRGIDVDLPKSATNTIQPEERIVLTVSRRQTVFLDREEMSLGRLEQSLTDRAKTNPEIAVYLRADEQVPYGMIVQIMDIIKRVGIDRLGMVTNPVEPESLR
ncbi:MAG: ExbD/TolR family protein [Nitrospiria bacterium]